MPVKPSTPGLGSKSSSEEIKKETDEDFNLPTIPQEDIDRMTLQEDLSEADRIKILLSKKDQP
jgi:hypothetical protein